MRRKQNSMISTLLAVASAILWHPPAGTAALMIGGQNLTSPSSTSCDASYSLPCSRLNAKWLAETVSEDLGRRLQTEPATMVFQDVDQGKYNYEGGFFPFIFDRNTTRNVGHGMYPALRGMTLQEILETAGVGLTRAQDLQERAERAAQEGGGWISYIWWDGDIGTGSMKDRIAYVTNVTDQYCIVVGFINEPLPLDLPCTVQADSWCSLTNVQSLMGRAETRFMDALSQEQFEAAAYAISYDPEFVAPGGHYLYLYHFDGTLRAHPYLTQYIGKTLAEINEILGGDPEEGQRIHEMILKKLESGNSWIKHSWTDANDGTVKTRVAHVTKIEFRSENYYLGSFFMDVRGDVVPSTYRAELGLEEATCPGYNLPCSFGNTLRLTSHALTHLISTDQTLDEAFHDITYDPRFKIDGGVYTFVVDFNGTMVSHAVESFIGKNLGEVWIMAGFEADAGWETHQKFRDAADQGGGYVLYDWSVADLSVDTEQKFQKVSYVFKISRDGRDYYGGVGFDHRRAPLHPELDTGTRKNGRPIPCSSQYASKCSELNSQAILGQALGDLVAASSETKSPAGTSAGLASKIEEVFANITAGNELYSFNDFHVAVFSFDQSSCYGVDGRGDMVDVNGLASRDESGCCIAHGGNSSYVGMTWQQILNNEGITSIRGRDLHNQLAGQVDRGGHWLEYTWAKNAGAGRNKIAFASRFRDDGKHYYVMTEFYAEQPPPTCNACPGNMECVNDSQAFCEWAEPPFRETSGFIILLSVLLGVPCLGLSFCWMGKKGEERLARAQIESIDQQMQTMSKQMEHQMKSTSNAHKLVASLFPKQVHDRIMQQIEEEAEDVSTEHDTEAPIEKAPTKDEWKQFMNDGGSAQDLASSKPTKGSAPICDLFPEATISFADIVGFTAWSSTREPTQVFSLLESIYRRFDRLANKMGVFKVETVGDCYVAVCGLPEQRDDHAIVMARFMTACLSSFKVCVADLELELGPGTADLSLRGGLHSGPVTAGVLRGERGRFQLFGDTVNTAARMESTSIPNRIHMSQETVTLLLDAGKSHWSTIREDKVVAKGKGLLNTYWLQVTTADLNDKNLLGDSSAGTETSSTTSSSDPDPKKQTRLTPSNFVDKRQGLVEWNLNLIKSSLGQIVAKRKHLAPTPTTPEVLTELESEYLGHCSSLNEVKEIVTLPTFDAETASIEISQAELNEKVTGQLRTYIHNLSMMYNDNPFHNFHHATHVTMSVVKLMSRIVAPEQLKMENTSVAARTAGLHDYSYGITSDPLTQFAVLLSALIHDADHPGVPNAQLVKEGASLASIYKQRSVAELNSLDLAWNLLMEETYKDLRDAIYQTEAEFLRFRQLMVNIVLATDIIDKDLDALRKGRWNKAFAQGNPEHCSTMDITERELAEEHVNRKATIVLEHLIQASDVAHTMQHWNVYLKWNERFFFECYDAYKQGRAEKDPIENWYQGEIGFFDYYIIPLAKKLKDCGVFGVSSAEYLRYAEQNRKEWEARGKEILAGYVEKVSLFQKQRRASSGFLVED